MTSLLTSLQGASTALSAYSQALSADQLNVSNSSTPGYAAVKAIIQPVGFGSGGGEDTVVLQSAGSAQADAIVQAASSQASDSQTQAQQLGTVNQQFDITGSTGILAAFQQFSTAFANLSVSPSDPSVAATALAAAGNVAAAFNSVAANLQSQSNSIQSSAQTTVSQINDLAGQIAQYNVGIRAQSDFNPGTDASQRSALTQLSSLVGITVNKNADGTLNVLAGGTIPLVLGDQAYTLGANLGAAPGSQITSSGGGSTPSSFSGTLGGLVDTFNNTITPILGGNGQTGSLNTLAQGFASTVNTLLTSGVTSSGAAGVPVFTYDTTNPANTAATLSVDPSVTANQLAVATTGAAAGTSAQSNGIANTLASLAGSNSTAYQIGGLAPQDYYSSIAQSVGQKLSDATTQATSDQTTLTSATANQTAVEGVSLDQEAVNITAYQRAWEASAKVISVLDNLTLDSVNLVGEQDT
jgi:flagellar hook-associated protein 1 FlgK